MKWTEGDSSRFGPLEQSTLDKQLRDAVTHDESQFAVRNLIDKGARVNPQSNPDDISTMMTPLLHIAARMNRAAVAEVLCGADREKLDIRDMFGRNALHVAALEGHGAATHVLLQMGLDPTAQDLLGFTPVDLAQARGHDALVSIFRANNKDLTLREDVDELRAEVAAAYPQTEKSHVRQVRQRREDPGFPDIPIR